ncbi:hypothetical protein ACFTAO_50940 [Paenibacillus rhizoplanae]
MKGGRAFPAAAPFAAFFRYLLIIVAALLFVPVVIPLTIAIYSIFGGLLIQVRPRSISSIPVWISWRLCGMRKPASSLTSPLRISPGGCQP